MKDGNQSWKEEDHHVVANLREFLWTWEREGKPIRFCHI